MTRKGDTYLTDELVNRVVASLRSGNYLTTAFRAAGIIPRTGQLWIAQGRRDLAAGIVSLYARLASETDAARAESEGELVGLLRTLGSEGDSKAIMFLLERRHPKRWGKPEKPKDSSDLTPEQTAALQAALSERPR